MRAGPGRRCGRGGRSPSPVPAPLAEAAVVLGDPAVAVGPSAGSGPGRGVVSVSVSTAGPEALTHFAVPRCVINTDGSRVEAGKRKTKSRATRGWLTPAFPPLSCTLVTPSEDVGVYPGDGGRERRAHRDPVGG